MYKYKIYLLYTFIKVYKQNQGIIPLDVKIKYAKEVFKLTSNYDIITWMNTVITSSLKNFRKLNKERILFELSKEQYDLVEDNLKIYGDTPTGRSQLLKVIPKSKIWRTPVKVNQPKSTEGSLNAAQRSSQQILFLHIDV